MARFRRNNEAIGRIHWVLVSRLIVFLCLIGAILIFLRDRGILLSLLSLYGVGTLIYLVALLSNQMRRKFPIPLLLGFQLAFEVFLEAGIVHYSGGIASPFAFLFIFSIISAGIIFQLRGSLIVAALASGAYEFTIWLESRQILFLAQRAPLFSSSSYASNKVFLTIYLSICFFFLTAFVSGYLSQKLKKRSEELEMASTELRKARLDTDDILQHLNSGLITVDNQGKILYFNEMAGRILDLNGSEVRDKKIDEAFAGELSALSARLRMALQERRPDARGELTIIRSGREVPLGINISMLEGEDGELRGSIVVFQDLTQVKQMEERVRRADRLAAVGELAASLAHEIRNPLASIRGSVEVLAGELQLQGENRRLMDLIIKESDRLNGVLRDFLSFARPPKGDPRLVDLRLVVQEVTELLVQQPSFGPEMDLQTNLGQAPLWVEADENLLKQVFLNLGLNALEAVNGKGKITVDAVHRAHDQSINNHFISIAFRDDGKGMSSEERRMAFQPFYSTKKEGTGLGLPIVERIIGEHGGLIEVDSEPGQGTTFFIHFKRSLTNGQRQRS